MNCNCYDGYIFIDNKAIPCEKCDKYVLNQIRGTVPEILLSADIKDFESSDKVKNAISGYCEEAKTEKKAPHLLLWGNPGRGKSWLAVALMKYLVTLNFHCVFFNVVEMFEELKKEFEKSYGDKKMTCALNYALEHADIFILDDLGAESSSDWKEEKIYQIVNALYSRGATIIITTNLHPNEMSERFHDRILSRFITSCDSIQLQGEDRRRTRERVRRIV